MKILISAEPQGFGLISTAKTIASFLKGNKVDFIATGLSYDYLKNERINVYRLQNYQQIDLFHSLLKKYDIFLSVNESKLAIIAKKLGSRVIYFDLLYWLWPDSLSRDILTTAKIVFDQPVQKLTKNFDTRILPKYDLNFLRRRSLLSITAGLAADTTFIQDFPRLDDQQRSIVKNLQNMYFIQPIIPLHLFKNIQRRKSNRPKHKVFISLGGLPPQNNYEHVFSKALQILYKKMPFKLASSNLKDKNCPPHKLYKQNEFWKIVKQSEIIVMPPGFVTMFEVFGLKKPIIYLPPKNAGQHRIFQIFKDYKLAEFSIDWEDIYPEVKSRKNSWDIMRIIERKMSCDQELPTLLSNELIRKLNDLQKNPSSYKTLLKRQVQFLKDIHRGNGWLRKKLLKILEY